MNYSLLHWVIKNIIGLLHYCFTIQYENNEKFSFLYFKMTYYFKMLKTIYGENGFCYNLIKNCNKTFLVLCFSKKNKFPTLFICFPVHINR